MTSSSNLTNSSIITAAEIVSNSNSLSLAEFNNFNTVLSAKLNLMKSCIDYFPNFKAYDPFKRYKYFISFKLGFKNITNAWLKFYEMFFKFDLIPYNTKIIHFDNAALPGTTILAAIHYSKTIAHSYNEWYASSLYPKRSFSKLSDPLCDTYGMYQKHPYKWLMNEINNGDLTNTTTPQYLEKAFLNKTNKRLAHLYTSDLGYAVGDDFCNQEKLLFKGHLGQVLTGLLVLCEHGNFVCKQFTMFNSETVGLVYLLSDLFREFRLYKPYTSKGTNSEMYLIGIGYKRSKSVAVVNELLEKFKCGTYSEYLSKIIPNGKFLYKIKEFTEVIYERQIKLIKDVLFLSSDIIEDNMILDVAKFEEEITL